jgi:hypothetical protein
MVAAMMWIGASGWAHGAVKHVMGERSGEIFLTIMMIRREQTSLLDR